MCHNGHEFVELVIFLLSVEPLVSLSWRHDVDVAPVLLFHFILDKSKYKSGATMQYT